MEQRLTLVKKKKKKLEVAKSDFLRDSWIQLSLLIWSSQYQLDGRRKLECIVLGTP